MFIIYFLLLLSILKFSPVSTQFSTNRPLSSQCTAINSLDESCFMRRECTILGGTILGACTGGSGVRCVFQKSCGTTANVNNTYFTNPSYPKPYDGEERCAISVTKCSPNICQLRLDFLEFSLAQPTSEGICDTDLFVVSGGSSKVPRICGENADQHVYVEFEGSNPITMTILTSSELTMKRRWNIRIQQIACNSQWRAPSGCLQYYSTLSGNIMSFNFGTTSNPRLSSGTKPQIGTREMAGLNYGICVKAVSGYCSVKWSAADANSFSVSGDGTSLTAASGATCTSDYIIIPNPSEVGATSTASAADRFCGSSFTPKITSIKPFAVYVVTDTTETTATVPDLGNKGFSLLYKQMICPI